MSWLRLDADYHADGTLRRCRAVVWWPLILCALKRGNGVASDDDLSPEVLADIGQGREEDAALALERLKAAGKLVAVDGGGWTTPHWSDMQPDPTNSDRQRRWRERNAASSQAAERSSQAAEPSVTVRNGYAPLHNGDVTLRNATKRSVTPDRTGHDVTGPQRSEAVVTTSRAIAGTPARETPAAAPPGLREVEQAWVANSGRRGVAPGAIVLNWLHGSTEAHGAEAVIRAIEAAAKANTRQALSTNYVEAFLADRSRGGWQEGNDCAQPRVTTIAQGGTGEGDDGGLPF